MTFSFTRVPLDDDLHRDKFFQKPSDHTEEGSYIYAYLLRIYACVLVMLRNVNLQSRSECQFVLILELRRH